MLFGLHAPLLDLAIMPVNPPQVLLLDAGNTLVYLDHEALAAVACAAGVPVDAATLRAAEAVAKRRYEASMRQGVSHAAGWDLHMQALFEAAGVDPARARTATAAAAREHASFNLWRRVPAGLPERLATARERGLRLGVVSNSEGKLGELFVRVGIDRYFEIVVDSALEGVRKPDPEIFRRALARLGVAPSVALYAGDIPEVDVVGARAAGIDAVLIDTHDHYPDYRDAPRHASVATLLTTLGF
jgi:HAD superfamily hydrolase (TIGR01509 family)